MCSFNRIYGQKNDALPQCGTYKVWTFKLCNAQSTNSISYFYDDAFKVELASMIQSELKIMKCTFDDD